MYGLSDGDRRKIQDWMRQPRPGPERQHVNTSASQFVWVYIPDGTPDTSWWNRSYNKTPYMRNGVVPRLTYYVGVVVEPYAPPIKPNALGWLDTMGPQKWRMDATGSQDDRNYIGRDGKRPCWFTCVYVIAPFGRLIRRGRVYPAVYIPTSEDRVKITPASWPPEAEITRTCCIIQSEKPNAACRTSFFGGLQTDGYMVGRTTWEPWDSTNGDTYSFTNDIYEMRSGFSVDGPRALLTLPSTDTESKDIYFRDTDPEKYITTDNNRHYAETWAVHVRYNTDSRDAL